MGLQAGFHSDCTCYKSTAVWGYNIQGKATHPQGETWCFSVFQLCRRDTQRNRLTQWGIYTPNLVHLFFFNLRVFINDSPQQAEQETIRYSDLFPFPLLFRLFQGRSKPKLENLEPRNQDLARFSNTGLFQTQKKENPEKRCHDVNKWSHLSQVQGLEDRNTFGSTEKKNFETRQRHIEPGMWRSVTKMRRHIFSSTSFTQPQVQVLGKFRLGTIFLWE